MQRPIEITWFERIIFVTLALGIIQSAVAWETLTSMASPVFVLGTQAFVFGLMAVLTLLVSRRRSNAAKWISVALFVIGLPMMLKHAIAGQLAGMGMISVVQTAGQLAAYALLFTPAARRWFGGDAVAV